MVQIRLGMYHGRTSYDDVEWRSFEHVHGSTTGYNQYCRLDNECRRCVAIFVRNCNIHGSRCNSGNRRYLQTADGSSVTISGLTAPLTGLNGTFQINAQVDSGSAGNFIVIINTGQASLSASQTGTFTYYPALTPVICFGNDDSTNAGALGALNFGIDFFCLAWNKGIINPANTPTATLARYW